MAGDEPAQHRRPVGGWRTLAGTPPLVIGHRGACGYLPEHTLASYRKAIELGADFVEPDLVVTGDGELVARHEPNITDSTDIAARAEFADRRTTKTVDGIRQEGWFAGDFALDELRSLRARQVNPGRDQSYNDCFAVPTLREILDLVRAESLRLGRRIGVYPEIKHPSYHEAEGLPIEARLLSVLAEYGYTHRESPLIIQSFEAAGLKKLRAQSGLRLMQLIGGSGVNGQGRIVLSPPFDRPYDFVLAGDQRRFTDMVTPQGLAEIRTYADGIGPWKPYLQSAAFALGGDGRAIDLDGDGRLTDADRVLLPPSDLLRDAHAAGLFVHVYTFRNEATTLAADYRGDPLAEYRRFYTLGVDGVFSDFPDTAVAARNEL